MTFSDPEPSQQRGMEEKEYFAECEIGVK